MPERGTAPGLVADLPDGKRLYAVPGVPAEMREMMDGTVLPELAELAGPGDDRLAGAPLRRASGSRGSRSCSRDLFEASANPSVAYLASSGEVKVRLTAKAPTEAEADALLAPLVDEVRARLGDVVFTSDDEELEEAVGRLLAGGRARRSRAPNRSPAAGSATRLTRVPGRVGLLPGLGGRCTRPEAKRDVLGVSQATIDGPAW